MLKDQGLPSLKDRRMAAALTFFYKLVEGLVPPGNITDAFLKPQRQKRLIHAKKFKDFDTKNIIETHSIKNSRAFVVDFFYFYFLLAMFNHQ